MSLIEILRTIFINIRENKFKVFLTSLGIIVGALTIVLVIAIGKGSEAKVREQFKALSAENIDIMSGREPSSPSLDESLVNILKQETTAVKDVTISINGNGEASYNGNSFSSSVLGAMENYKETSNLNIEYGNFITEYDNERRKKVVVVGYDVANELFGEEKTDAIGQNIIIKGKKYEIVGILKRIGSSMPGFNSDESVIVPYKTAQKYVVGKRSKPRITVTAKDVDSVELAMEEITKILQKEYKGKSDSFMIRNAGSMLTAAQDSAKTMSLLLMAIGTIVLAVGGIGIMNVLFVSVQERTKEIGILKAIGARRKDILLQFLLEAIIISASGGVIGIFLSMIIMPLMKYTTLTVVSSAYGYIMALLFSIGTGTFFGYYPALKASSLKPIDALNYD